MTYLITYWLPKQSRLFSQPRVFEASDAKEKNRTILSCIEHGYEIEEIRAIREENQND